MDEFLESDRGPLQKLLYYQDLSDRRNHTHRRYDLWVTFSSSETWRGAMHHFELLLANPEATDAASSRNFSLGSGVIALSYKELQI